MRNLIILFTALAVFASCNDDTKYVNPNTQMPEIISLSTDKTEIMIGEYAEISCEATGGELIYEWDVILGDIIPQNEEGSVVRYSGSECCSGERVVSCTVRNDKGEAEDVVSIFILQ